MSGALAGKTILLVEDEPIVLLALQDMLESFGARAAGPATTLARGLALAESEPSVDAAILDVNLNGEKSFPIADVLRRRAVPVIFATGYRDTAFPEFGDATVIEKPYSNDRLLSALTAAMGKA